MKFGTLGVRCAVLIALTLSPFVSTVEAHADTCGDCQPGPNDNPPSPPTNPVTAVTTAITTARKTANTTANASIQNHTPPTPPTPVHPTLPTPVQNLMSGLSHLFSPSSSASTTKPPTKVGSAPTTVTATSVKTSLTSKLSDLTAASDPGTKLSDAQLKELQHQATAIDLKAGAALANGGPMSPQSSAMLAAQQRDVQAAASELSALSAAQTDAAARQDLANNVQKAAGDLTKQIITLLKELKDGKANAMAAITRA